MPAAKRKNDQAAPAPPAGPVCLPLVKLSQALVVQNSNGPLPWTHLLSQGDLFAVFETTRTLNSDGSTTDSRRFKVLQDPNIIVCLLTLVPFHLWLTSVRRILISMHWQPNLDELLTPQEMPPIITETTMWPSSRRPPSLLSSIRYMADR
jgi:hypothetical protein